MLASVVDFGFRMQIKDYLNDRMKMPPSSVQRKIDRCSSLHAQCSRVRALSLARASSDGTSGRHSVLSFFQDDQEDVAFWVSSRVKRLRAAVGFFNLEIRCSFLSCEGRRACGS